jgi:hypothetical protein
MQTSRLPRVAAAGALALALGLPGCTQAPTGSVVTVSTLSSGGPSPSGSSSGGPSPRTPSSSPPPRPSPTPGPTGLAQLPRGGRTIFPRYRLFGYSGGPGSEAFGRLGIGDIDARVREIERRAPAFAAGRRPMPVLELITVVALDHPGPRGTYSNQVKDQVIDDYLAAARRHRALLLLNVQPGREDFLPVVRRLERWLHEPDVGLALDPEWAVGPRQVPGQTYGHTTGAEIDGVAGYLDALVTRDRLPQKALVFHQVARKVVTGQSAIRTRPGVVVVKSVDGIGTRDEKTKTWRVLVRSLPPSLHTGLKLFFVEDARRGPLMTPPQVLALTPRPEYVLYE